MFESAEIGHAIDRRAYDREVPTLRAALLAAQMRILDRSEFPIILLSGGVDGGGRSEVVNLLLEWMDPRHIHAHAMGDRSDEERDRPPMWRFWRALPPNGRMAVFFGSWYTAPIVDRVYDRLGGGELSRSLVEIARFERMLVDEGALVVKLWLHLSKKAQRRRLERLAANPLTAWRVTHRDWKNHAHYDRFREVSARALRETSTAEAPWTVIEATDARYRNLTVGRTLLDAMTNRLKRGKRLVPVRAAPPPLPAIDARNVVEELDLTKSLSEGRYQKLLPNLQSRLNALARHKRFEKLGVVVVFEGSDAAGKGGTIRRVTRALDARVYQVVPIAAPTEEERAHPYLWRFWRHVPRKGHIELFDRSWYGRVLVERVEGLAAEADWMRAYREIVDFEDSLARAGIVVVKFWLALSKKEQLARFRAREKTAFKRFKLTREDWRNRGKWDAYEQAVCDMVDRTSTSLAPWHLVEADDKRWARVKVLETLCTSIDAALSSKKARLGPPGVTG
jgi:polyphosphate:AMP phosphotransferase